MRYGRHAITIPKAVFPRQSAIIAIVAGFALASCGGGGSSNSGPPPAPSDLSVSITFPLDGAATDAVDTLVVSGTIEDLSDGQLTARDIASFSVNGANATVDYASGRWRAEVPLRAQTVEIATQVTAVNGSSNQASVSLRNSPFPDDYQFLRASPDGTSALVYGSGNLRRVDLGTGDETLVASGLSGKSIVGGIRDDPIADAAYLPRLDSVAPRDVVQADLAGGNWTATPAIPVDDGYCCYYSFGGFDFDALQQRLVYAYQVTGFDYEVDYCDLRAVSTTTGEVSILADTGAVPPLPGGPSAPICAGPVVVDPDNNRAIVTARYNIDPSQHIASFTDQLGVYAYDLATGAAQVVSDAQHGSGPLLSQLQSNAPQRLFRDPADGRLIAIKGTDILGVDPVTGDRQRLLEDPNIPANIDDMDYDPVNQRLLITTDRSRISALDLGDGSLQTLLEVHRAVGSGPDVESWKLGIVDSAARQLYNFDYDRLMALDLKTLQREVVVPKLPPGGIAGPALDAEGTQLYFGVRGLVLAANLTSGAITLVAPSAQGSSGPALWDINSLSVDYDNGLLYASAAYEPDYAFHGLISIDIATGARELLVEAPDATKDMPLNLYDADQHRVIGVRENGEVLAIDPRTGETRLLTDNTGLAQEQQVQKPTGVAWDSAPGRILVWSLYRGSILSIDLSTGARSIVGCKGTRISFDRASAVFFGNLGDDDLSLYACDRYTGSVVTVARQDGAGYIVY